MENNKSMVEQIRDLGTDSLPEDVKQRLKDNDQHVIENMVECSKVGQIIISDWANQDIREILKSLAM